MKFILSLLLGLISVSAFAQDTLGTSVLYKADDRIMESNSGIESYVPRGWVGVEPKGEEAFLFVPVNHDKAQMMIMIYKLDNRDSLRQIFREGLQLPYGMDAKPVQQFDQRNGWITTNLDIEEAGKDISAYAEGKCENGYCAVNVLIADRKDLDALKYSVFRLSDHMEFNNGMGMR